MMLDLQRPTPRLKAPECPRKQVPQSITEQRKSEEYWDRNNDFHHVRNRDTSTLLASAVYASTEGAV